jgi:hypothetical protein
VLRTLALLEADEANQSYMESVLSGATLSGLHVFSLSFYKKLINYDGRDGGQCFIDFLPCMFWCVDAAFFHFSNAGILSNAPRYTCPQSNSTLFGRDTFFCNTF